MFDPYHKWLGIHKKYRPLTLYRLLGIDPAETDVEVIEEAAIRQISHLRAYQSGEHGDVCARVMEEIAKAREILTTPEKRRAYDAKLARLRKKPAAAKEGTDGVGNSNHGTIAVEAVEPSPFADLVEQNVVVAPTSSTTVTPCVSTDVLPQVEARKPVAVRKKGLPINLIGRGVGLVVVLGIVLGVMLWSTGNNISGPNGGGLDGTIAITAKSTAKGILLEWNNIPGAKYYEVQRGGSESGPWTTLIEKRTTNQFVDARGAGSVWYRVRASDGENLGEWSSAGGKIQLGNDRLLLDEIKGAVAAYSLRKLRSDYSGPAIRVRRSSDNKEQDIEFFDVALDSKSLFSFTGENEGFLVKWYDQSGYKRDRFQTDFSSQAQIVKNGKFLVTLNGRAGVSYRNQNDFTLSWGMVSQPFTRNYVATRRNSAGFVHMINSTAGSPNTTNWSTSPNNHGLNAEGTGAIYLSCSWLNGQSAVFTTIFNGKKSLLSKNRENTIEGFGGLLGFDGIRYGGFQNKNQCFDNDAFELIVFGRAISESHRSMIEVNQMKYYGIN